MLAAVRTMFKTHKEQSAHGGDQSLALAKAPGARLSPYQATAQSWNDSDWQKLWLACQRVEWRSLALLPSGEMPAEFTLEIAVALMRIGSIHLDVPIRIADGTAVPLPYLSQFLSEMNALAKAGDRVLVALSPLRDSPTSMALAEASDRVLLCVPLGASKVSDAKLAVAEIGPQKFLGSVPVHLA
jgi:hypothetical protein